MAQSRQRSAQAMRLLESGQLDQAVVQSREALKIHEQNVEAMCIIAEVFFRQGKYELTLAVTSSILAVDERVRTPSETSRGYGLRGFAHAAMGNDRAATDAFKQAAEADDRNAVAWNNLGTRYLDAGDANTAVQCFSYALELDPRLAKAHLNLGAALRAQRKWQEAERSLLAALSLRSNYPEVYFNLGLLYLDADPFPGLDTNGRLRKAIDYLTKYKNTAAAPDPASAAAMGSRSRSVRGRPGATPGPAPVSKERADDYIRVAQKGLEREQRRMERERKRQTGTEESSDDAGEGAPPPARPSSGAPKAGTAPSGGGDGKPAQPSEAPAEPNERPAEPSEPAKPAAPQSPGKPPSPAKPSRPASPPGSGPSPQRPAPQRPSTAATSRLRDEGGPSSDERAPAGNPPSFDDTIPRQVARVAFDFVSQQWRLDT